MAGPHYQHGGGGSNFLCLHERPQWHKYFGGIATWAGIIYGTQLQQFADQSVFSTVNNEGNLQLFGALHSFVDRSFASGAAVDFAAHYVR